jgi:hypothetical protein
MMIQDSCETIDEEVLQACTELKYFLTDKDTLLVSIGKESSAKGGSLIFRHILKTTTKKIIKMLRSRS